ncbi:hypothetical protein, partial [Allofournierella massiliensis]|uniref:hypothetical protein n=1 Tax=Allofournierella massiliensis TaxID=1650663 RepID=UPI0035644485
SRRCRCRRPAAVQYRTNCRRPAPYAQCTMDAVTTHHFSGLGAPFVRSKGTVSGGVFNAAIMLI